ncbi:MAG: hypothetical protein ACREEP_07600 [Dongiaceae bacterium]
MKTAGYALTLLCLALGAAPQAIAQTERNKYGYCQGLAGNPRVNNYTRLFALGPSSPPGAMSGFLQFLHQKYAGYTTQEVGCRTFATPDEAKTAYQQMLDEGAQAAHAWPLVEIDWIPQGGSTLSGGASAPTPVTPAAAQSQPYRHGFCYGVAGNPRANHITRAFVVDPSTRQDSTRAHFGNYLYKKYGEFVSRELTCRWFASAAEAEDERRKMMDEARKYPAGPFTDVDWIPDKASSLSGAAPAPAASAGPKLDIWGRPIPTSAYWVCNSYVGKNSYASAPFVANTLDRSPQEMFAQFLDYLNKKFHEGGTATCNKYATQSEAEQRIAQLSAEAPGHGRQFAMLDWTFKPGTSPATAPAQAAPVPAKPAPAKPAPATAAVKPGLWVICRSEWNTDLRRFYNPPVDGRGAGYPEWQASYRQFLVSHHKFKGSNLGCGKYPTREAAQKDFESWVVQARQQPTINGKPSPVLITNWKY